VGAQRARRDQEAPVVRTDLDSLLEDEDMAADFDFRLTLHLAGVATFLADRTSSSVSAPTP